MNAAAASAIAATFARCLAHSAAHATPFPYWLLADVLPPDAAHAIAHLPLPPPIAGETHGKRETFNQQRVFIAGERLDDPVCRALALAFQAPETVQRLAAHCGAALGGTSLRIEYCQDTGGFWLEPHTDIGAKRFTMLIYLSEGPAAADWGTDLYDAALAPAGRAPAGFNRGLIFVPGADTWHGFRPRDIRGIRRSLIVNYVGPEWRAQHELAFPAAPVA
jgi:hypothetical protein